MLFLEQQLPFCENQKGLLLWLPYLKAQRTICNNKINATRIFNAFVTCVVVNYIFLIDFKKEV